MKNYSICILAAASLTFFLPGIGSANELEYKIGGKLQSDLRFRIDTKSVGDYYKGLELQPGVARNENVFKLKFETWYRNVAGVIDIDFVWLGYPEQLVELGDLTERVGVSPYYLQAHSAYIEATDIFVDGLDLKVGQQLVLWGVGDQFNPTNNINSNDVEDVFMFGEQIANFMVRADYNFLDQWSLSGVLIPVFKPAQLPRSAELGLAMVDRLPFIETHLRYRMQLENFLSGMAEYPTTVAKVEAQMPERNFENMPFAFRLAGVLFEQDIAISYYRGRHDFPQARQNYTWQTKFESRLCNPAVENPDPDIECEDGVYGLMESDVILNYPRMQVLGFNLAGEIPLDWISKSILGLGYRIEIGIYFPERQEYTIMKDDVVILGIPLPGGQYDYRLGKDRLGNDRKPLVVDDTVFAKWVLGLDYTFGPHVMLNLMWVHGMADEFGAGDFLNKGFVVRQGGVDTTIGDPVLCFLNTAVVENDQAKAAQICGNRYTTEVLRPRIGDYIVFGIDLKFADDNALFRLFTIWDISGYYRSYYDTGQGRRVLKYQSLFGDGFSMIIFPEFNYNFGNGLEIGLGALFQLGKQYTKFGDPAAGGSLAWTRARYSF
ncbi:MAG: hypothetical protein JRJ87_14230 [Deltaproteobacteria bacterium]|nr:hypothetical protein [Deltaproteobacteria bacterium]